MENKQLKEFAEKVKSMPVDQLIGYKSAAKNLNRALSFFGISFILLIISYPTIPVITAGSLLVYLLGKTSEGVSLTLDLVKEQLAKLENT